MFSVKKIPDEMLMESFLKYVSKDERDLINAALKDDDLKDNQQKEWLDFRDTWLLTLTAARTIPRRSQKIILAIAGT